MSEREGREHCERVAQELGRVACGIYLTQQVAFLVLRERAAVREEMQSEYKRLEEDYQSLNKAYGRVEHERQRLEAKVRSLELGFVVGCT